MCYFWHNWKMWSEPFYKITGSLWRYQIRACKDCGIVKERALEW